MCRASPEPTAKRVHCDRNDDAFSLMARPPHSCRMVTGGQRQRRVAGAPCPSREQPTGPAAAAAPGSAAEGSGVQWGAKSARDAFSLSLSLSLA